VGDEPPDEFVFLAEVSERVEGCDRWNGRSAARHSAIAVALTGVRRAPRRGGDGIKSIWTTCSRQLWKVQKENAISPKCAAAAASAASDAASAAQVRPRHRASRRWRFGCRRWSAISELRRAR